MKPIAAIIFLFISLNSFSQSCDSIIVISYDYYDYGDHDGPAWMETDSIKNGNVVCVNNNYYGITRLEYDSLQRLISRHTTYDSIVYTYDTLSRQIYIDNYWKNLGIWVYQPNTARFEHLFNIHGGDSVLTTYSWNGSILFPVHKNEFYYDVNNNVANIKVHDWDTTHWVFDTLIIASYSSGSRVDSVFVDSVSDGHPEIILYYDLSDRIYLKDYYEYNYDQPDYYESFIFDGNCNVQTGYSASCYGCHSGHFNSVYLNSQCRIAYREEGGYNSSGESYTLYNYYYADCANMAIFSSIDKQICKGDSVDLSASFFGGTPPFQVQWIPSAGIVSDSSLTTKASPDSTTKYVILVTDSNGVSISDTVKITVIDPVSINLHVESFDTSSACQSAVLATDSVYDGYYYWHTDTSVQYLGYYSHLTIYYNANYVLQVGNNQCPEKIDTLSFFSFSNPAPKLNLTSECDHIIASTDRPCTFEWYYNYHLIPGFSGDTLPAAQNGDYSAIAIDSLGCRSQQVYAYFSDYTVNVQIIKSCADSCNGYLAAYPNMHSQFLWSTGDTTFEISDLCPGIYSLTISGATGCILTLHDTVNAYQRGNYSYINSGTTGALCDGLVIPVDTDNIPYRATFLWEDSTGGFPKDSLCAGWHYVLTTPNFSSCPQRDSFFIANSHSTDTCSAVFSTTNAFCFGMSNGVAVVHSSTGSPFACHWLPLSGGIAFNTTRNGLHSGSYDCMIMDKNGCIDTGTVIISEPPIITSTVSIFQNGCGDSCVVIANAAGGVPPYNYRWCNNVYGQIHHGCEQFCIYTIYDSHNCWVNDTVNQPVVNPVTFTTTNTTVSCIPCHDGTIIVDASGGTPPYSYSVDLSAPNSNDTLTNLSGGIHYVCVTDAVGCSICDYTAIALGIEEEEKFPISVYPNPFSDEVMISFPQSFATNGTLLILSNMLGKIARTIDVKENPMKLKRGDLVSGIYVLSVLKDENIAVRKRIIVE